MDLLYLTCSTHAYVKLRIHTDTTLTSLLQFTVRLGSALRRFYKEVCLKYETQELEAESQKRIRKQALEFTSMHAVSASAPTPKVRRRAPKKIQHVTSEDPFLG